MRFAIYVFYLTLMMFVSVPLFSEEKSSVDSLVNESESSYSKRFFFYFPSNLKYSGAESNNFAIEVSPFEKLQ